MNALALLTLRPLTAALAIIIGVTALNDGSGKKWRGICLFAIRIAGAVVAAGCFLGGLWFAFRQPAKGFMLMGLGIVFGIVFGRVPSGKKIDAG